MNWSKGRRGGKLAGNRLTYANVISTIAIFIALGGSSYAAMSLPPDSVGAGQIRPGAVGSRDIQHGAIQPADLSQRLARGLASALVPQSSGTSPQHPGTGLGASLGTAPFVPPRGNNACARWRPKDSSCVDVAGKTKKLIFLQAHTWILKCPPGTKIVQVQSGYSLGFNVPAYTIATTAGTYSGASTNAITGDWDTGLFTASNWTIYDHSFTPHTACTTGDIRP